MRITTMRHLLLSSLEHLGVELKLLSFEDVAVRAAALSRARGDAGQQTARCEGVIKGGVQSASLLSLLQLAGEVVRVGLSGLIGNLLILLHTDLDAVVLLVPSTEGGGINLDDGILHQSLGANQLVIGGIVHNIQDTSLAGGH